MLSINKSELLKMNFNYSSCYVLTIFFLINHAFCIENIDQEHFKLYPYCGRLFGYDSSNAKSRVVNSEDSLEFELYPWVVFLERKYKDKHNNGLFRPCGGTVIAYKYVIFIFQIFKMEFYKT